MCQSGWFEQLTETSPPTCNIFAKMKRSCTARGMIPKHRFCLALSFSRKSTPCSPIIVCVLPVQNGWRHAHVNIEGNMTIIDTQRAS